MCSANLREAALVYGGMRIVVLGALLAVAAACDPGAPAPETVVDEERPCELAAPAEIAAAIRADVASAAPVESRTSTDESRTLLCHYDAGRPYGSVTLHVETGVSEDEFRERMRRDPLNTDPLEGVGGMAFTHAASGVSVWEDGDAVSASLQYFGEPEVTRRTLEDLAALIDSKL